LSFLRPCIVIYSLRKNQQDAQYLKFILYWNNTLRISDGLSVHRQESKTVHTESDMCRKVASFQRNFAIRRLGRRVVCYKDVRSVVLRYIYTRHRTINLLPRSCTNNYINNHHNSILYNNQNYPKYNLIPYAPTKKERPPQP